MTKTAERYIAENRQDIRQNSSNFIEAAESGSIDLTFGRNLVEVGSISVEVYKRDLGNSLIVGHPNAADHGVAAGEVGDNRGGWTLVTSSTDTTEFVRTGRTAIRDALDGQNGGIREAGIGTGTADAATGDTDLQSLSSKVNAATVDGYRPDAKTARGTGVFLFHDHEDSVTEVALYNTDGSLLCRLTLPSDASPTAEEEVKVVVDLTVEGDGIGDSVVTDAGEQSIADALHFPYRDVGLNEIALGTGTAAFSKSDTSLTTEEFRRTVSRDLGLEAIRVSTRVFDNEPTGSLPITFSEMAVFDNESPARMVWATTFEGEEKPEGVPLRATVGFRIE